MTYFSAKDPVCKGREGAIELIIEPQAKDLGGFNVRRVLPASERRMVGPFIFFDHMGPAEFPPGQGIQVRPHPHIGLATVTYLFEGEILHRDSLGFVQPIRPGAVNLMTAGSGIVHSERAGSDIDTVSRLHGIQSWMALPTEEEECDPDFVHYPAEQLPQVNVDGGKVCVIMGEAYGHESPVKAYAPTLYLECMLRPGAGLELPSGYDELAVYVVSGRVDVNSVPLEGGKMAVGAGGSCLQLRAEENCHLMVIGGATLGKRHIWWNFVSSSLDRIEQAKNDWQERRFDCVPGEAEFIPLPG